MHEVVTRRMLPNLFQCQNSGTTSTCRSYFSYTLSQMYHIYILFPGYYNSCHDRSCLSPHSEDLPSPPLREYHPTCRSLQSVLVTLVIVVRYDDPNPRSASMTEPYECLDRSVAIVVNHVETAVKPDCRAPTMLSRRRKAPRAAEPKSSPSSERRRSSQI